MAKKLTTEEVRQRISEVDNGEYELVGEYKNSRTDITVRHICGRTMELKLDKFMGSESRKGQRCRCTYVNNNKVELDEFKKRLHAKHGDAFIIEDESKYVDIKTPIYFIHRECGSRYKTRPEHVLKCTECKKCSYTKGLRRQNQAKPFEDVVKEVSQIANGDFYIAESGKEVYKNNKTELPFVHKECGRVTWMSFNKFKSSNRRCKHCNISIGESLVSEFLDRNNIKYQREYKFDDCVDKGQLRFDFYLEDYGILIEFDGKQHFEPGFGSSESDAIENLEDTQRRDEIKNKYCEDNNIPLLRIKYTEIDRIDDILTDYLTSSTTIETVIRK